MGAQLIFIQGRTAFTFAVILRTQRVTLSRRHCAFCAAERPLPYFLKVALSLKAMLFSG